MPAPSTKRLAARILWANHRHAGLEVLAELVGVSLGGLHRLIKPLIPLHNAGDVQGVRDAIHQAWIAETDGSGLEWDAAYLDASYLIGERTEMFKRKFAAEVGHVAA